MKVIELIKPTVSIIIPTYNHAEFLRNALDSVCNQTFNEWEAIVVNNYSEDDTVEVVEAYNDRRIKLFNFENHGIIAAARNYGLSISNAPYVAFLDSDDLWYPKKLQNSIDMLMKGYDLVCHAEVWVGPGERRRKVYYGPESRATFENLLLQGNCLSTSAVLVRRESLIRANFFSVNPDFITAEDYDLWLKLSFGGGKFGFIDEVLGEYLIHEGNQSRQILRNMRAVRSVFDYHRSALENLVKPWRLRRREALILYSGARGLQDTGRHLQAFSYFIKAIFRYPLVLRFYLAMIINSFGYRP
ncbi:glycosyltransferase family 2 protein [Candidatus Methylopumilus universalis]|uniref:glycosyltransferase family 2 protein n=1 Tax=Candidatus Methylopumilus universalis TaxID=2588536 RepID=UPI00167B700E|nr:glycosyltransferase [Candidatus Methylopumilus universalis]